MPLEIVDEYRESAFAQHQTGLLFNLPAPPLEHEQLPEGLSLCMIVKNEERFLGECLRSVAGVVDEICIVDTGSTDRTVEIAAEFGAKIEHHLWRDDFAWAKNKALAMATHRWVLVLDADEEIAPESLALLRSLRKTPAGITAIYVSIRNLIDDEAGAATMTHMLPRIFPNTRRIRYRNRIHESIVLDGESEVQIVVSPIVVIHKGYAKAVIKDRDKTKRNAPLLSAALEDGGDQEYAYFNYGTAAITAGDVDAGIEGLEKSFTYMTNVRSFHSVAYAMLASAYAEREEGDRALTVLDEGLERCSGHPTLLFTKGYVLSLQRRFDEAREWYERAIETPADPRRHFVVDDEIRQWKAPLNIGVTFIKEARHEEAIPWFERGFSAKPESTRLRTILAACYERVGRFYDAERLLREAAQHGGSQGFVELVNLLLRRRRFAEALELVDRAEVAAPRVRAALQLSAAVALRDERLGDPEPYALRALELAPGFGQALAFLDAWYAAVGREPERVRLRADELAAPLVECGDYIRRTHRLLEEGRVQDALAIAESGLTSSPHDDMLHYNAALAAARANLDDVARDHLLAVRVGDADVAAAAIVLHAEIEQRAGDLEAAVLAFERAVALPRRDDPRLRAAAVTFAGSLMDAGRLAQAGRVAVAALG
jgi:glycosyltransferase involved in cell wall biosynthesis